MELSFTIKDGKRWQDGKFVVDGLTILDADDNYEVVYDDIQLFVDGKPYDGSAESWGGHKYTVDDIFEQVLSGYLKGDGTYTSFSEGWSAFKKLDDLKGYKGNLLVTLPVYNNDAIELYELELATPDNTYYSYGDSVMMLDKNNEVVTDAEHLYMEALEEDIESIINGQLECLYISPNIEMMINTMDSEES